MLHDFTQRLNVADNSTALNIVSTDADADTGPRVDLTRNSASPAANDILGQIRFMGEDAADNSLSYVGTYVWSTSRSNRWW